MCISTRLCKIILQSSYANMCNWNKHWYWSCLFRTACSLALFVEVLCLAIDLKKPTLFVVAWQSCPSSLVNLTRIAPSSSTFLNSVLLRPHVFCAFTFRSLPFLLVPFCVLLRRRFVVLQMAGFQTECFGKHGAAGRHFVLSQARLAGALLRGSEVAGSGLGLPAPLPGPPATLLQHLDTRTAAQQCCKALFSFRYPPQHLICYPWLPVKSGKKLLLRICCYPFPLLIYQAGYAVFGLSLLTNVHVELLVIFHIPRQVKLHLCLDFLDPISARPESVPAFFPGNTSLFPLPGCVTLSPQSDHQVLAQPCLFPALSTPFLRRLCHGDLI